MHNITPHIWFETEAKEAADFYTSLFKDSKITADVTLPDTPGGDARIISLALDGNDFQFISAGPLFERNPAISYMVACDSSEEVGRLWNALITGGTALMPLDTYPFSERYGWLNDKYGVSWQIMHDGGMSIQTITPCLLFVGEMNGRAEEAMNYYLEVFPHSTPSLPDHISRYGQDALEHAVGNKPEDLNYARFSLEGRDFVVMDSGLEHNFAFNEMHSFIISCDTQEEIDYYTDKLSHVPEAMQCGWVKDQFGVSWQIVPRRMEELMATATPEERARITQAFLPMKKLIIEDIERAYRGE